MLKAPKIFAQLCRKITMVLLASLVWLTIFPTNSVQADGYYSEKNNHAAISKPYYVAKERQIIVQQVPAKPYYSTKERRKEKVIIKTPPTANDYIGSGKRGQEVIPQD
ncbi:hypothetical protein [Nodularia sphaerocarpa]|uniref:hypothetical protein n=1 Tax=Nodularia sphaerocarpa TaxID=137816 RepID=UPI001EFC1E1B|nr:hypothetical protein [Nodularia sphaerocarpa]MDB9373182.1 hypothetical protein [Nodularia sphaerocarpa CS-585]ULP70658.1 hypothetical protein BDGGKGIB_00274 [Nodularia sphaerocarpa UHCC 0038]